MLSVCLVLAAVLDIANTSLGGRVVQSGTKLTASNNIFPLFDNYGKNKHFFLTLSCGGVETERSVKAASNGRLKCWFRLDGGCPDLAKERSLFGSVQYHTTIEPKESPV